MLVLAASQLMLFGSELANANKSCFWFLRKFLFIAITTFFANSCQVLLLNAKKMCL